MPGRNSSVPSMQSCDHDLWHFCQKLTFTIPSYRVQWVSLITVADLFALWSHSVALQLCLFNDCRKGRLQNHVQSHGDPFMIVKIYNCNCGAQLWSWLEEFWYYYWRRKHPCPVRRHCNLWLCFFLKILCWMWFVDDKHKAIHYFIAASWEFIF